MKKKFSVVLAASLVLGFVTLTFGQPSVTGNWLFDLSGAEQGLAVVTFNDTTFQGYGFILESSDISHSGGISIQGTYAVGEKNVISGTYEVRDEEGTLINSGTITGKVDKKGSKISLNFSNGPNAKGVRFTGDPAIPQNWLATGSGDDARLTFNTFSIVKDEGDVLSPTPFRVYSFSGAGTVVQDDVTNPVWVVGGFGVNSKNIAYGGYAAYADENLTDLQEEGVFSGKISSSKFSFNLTSVSPEVGLKAVFKGVVAP